MGARVPYSGELVEDSIVDWAGQLRYQLEKSFAEQFEHAIIDGDTATGGSTNINNIAGTPTSTGTKATGIIYVDANGVQMVNLSNTSKKVLRVSQLVTVGGEYVACSIPPTMRYGDI